MKSLDKRTKNKPIYVDDLSPEQLSEVLARGYKDVQEGKTISLE